ncbi:MAG: amino acid permease, partial [Nitrospirae bacterium]|nr:amino acid permease [Nitrospirota bacterium]
VFFAMSRDQLLGPWLSAVHPRFGTPHHATLLTGVGVAGMAAFVQIGEAADMTNIGTLFAFVLVCAAVLVLRRTKPDQPRPFRIRFMPWIPLLGMAACLGLMAFLPTVTWIRFGVWSVIGTVVYFLYGKHHSRLAAKIDDGEMG